MPKNSGGSSMRGPAKGNPAGVKPGSTSVVHGAKVTKMVPVKMGGPKRPC